MRRIRTDILILGAGGAGLFAALHAKRAAPGLSVTIAVKGLLGKCGCTRMVQGGYNVALAPGDSVERHFMDTIEGGKWLPDQELAWTLVTRAVERVHELENELGCFFDRNPDGTLHQKAFAGQTFDRTVHKGDLTGIEIINRLAEQVWVAGVERLEEHRAVELVKDADGGSIAGVLMIDMRDGRFTFVQARSVLLATGGGPTMYRYHTPSGDKSCDGLAMALRAGLTLRDMEMVQFHPTGLLAGPDTRMTGTVLEEGLRGAGGYLLNGAHERFMQALDPRAERATRDVVSRAIYAEMRAGRATPNGGVYLAMAHLGSRERRRPVQGDGGALRRLRVRPGRRPGRGGAHRALHDGRRGVRRRRPHRARGPLRRGRGHGRRARRQPPGRQRRGEFHRVRRDRRGRDGGVDRARRRVARAGAGALEEARARALQPLGRPAGDVEAIRETLHEIMWDDVGILRDARGLARARDRLDELQRALDATGVAGGDLRYHLGLARLAQPLQPAHREHGDPRGGRGPRRFARRPFPRGPPRDGGPGQLPPTRA